MSVEILLEEHISINYYSKIKDYSDDSNNYPIQIVHDSNRCYFTIRERLYPEGSKHPFPMHVSEFAKRYYYPAKEEIN